MGNETKPTMTPEEFEREMREVFVGHDPENEHEKADKLICNLLESLGYDDGVKVFKSATRWYG